jgi:hypothetical protein
MLNLDALAAILILGLVTYRISRVLPVDEIAQPFRDRIELWTYPEKELSPRSAVTRVWLGRLSACPVCIGWWVSALVVAFYSLVVVDDWFGWSFLIVWPATAAVGAVVALAVE